MIQVHSLKELPRVSEQLLGAFPDERVFAVYGELGVGKTTFIKAICRVLGVQDMVSSPSYSLINEYRRLNGESVYHFDFYRVRKLEEVFDLGYEDYFFSGNYCFIEWPEKLDYLLPSSCCKVFMEEIRGSRIIRVG